MSWLRQAPASTLGILAALAYSEVEPVGWSTAAIGRITPGRHQQRDVIMGLRLGDRELDRHDVEKRRVGARRAEAGEIVADVETQLVTPDRQRAPADQRPIGAAI